jgi:hypothetical protein
MSPSRSSSRYGRHATAALGAAVLLGAFASSASAQFLPVPPIVVVPPIDWFEQMNRLCSNNQPSQCDDPSYVSTCIDWTGNTCRAVLQERSEAQFNAAPIDLRRAPATPAFSYSAADTADEADTNPGEHAESEMNFSSVFENMRRSSNPRIRAKFTAMEANADTINSCVEYVYEKYYDVTAYSRAATPLLKDPRAVYDLAYGASTARTSIGTRHLGGTDNRWIKTRAGTNTKKAMNGNRLRSAYFQVAASQVGEDDAIMRDIRAKLIALQPTLMTKLDQNVTSGAETWDSQKTLSDHMESVTRPALTMPDGTTITRGWLDDELDVLYDRQERFVDKLERARFLQNTFKAKLGALIGGLAPRGVLCTIFLPNGQPADRCSGTTHGRKVDEALFVEASFELQYNQLMREMAAMLVEANGKGCLDSGITACTWSPKQFVDTSTNLMKSEMDTDFDKCVTAVNNAWNLSGYATLDIETTSNHSSPHYQRIQGNFVSSTATFDDYLGRLPEFLRKKGLAMTDDAKRRLAAQPQLLDPETKQLKLPGFARTGGEDIGNKYFGLNYDYDVHFGLKSIGRVCDVRPEAHAEFNVNVSLLTLEKQIVHAEAHADMGAGYYEYKIYGVAQDREVKEWGIPLNVTREKAWNPIAQGGTTFYIMGIPVNLSVGVSGRVGFDAGIALQAEGFGDSCNPDAPETKIGLGLHARPYGGIDGFASLAIGNELAKAGVKGYLTIIDAALPVAVDLDFVTKGAEDKFRLSTTTSIELSTLAGKLTVFAEALGGLVHAEKEIVKWKGLTWNKTLATYTYEVKASDLARVFN